MAADAVRFRDSSGLKFPFIGVPSTAPQRSRYHSGIVKLIDILVNGADTIKAGDLMYLAGAYARPAQAIAWNSNLATTQADFANLFLGVAWEDLSASAGNRSVIVECGSLAVYKYPLKVSSVFPLRQAFGPAQSGGSELLPDKLAEAAATTSAIAMALKENAEAGDDEAYVQFAGIMQINSINADFG